MDDNRPGCENPQRLPGGCRPKDQDIKREGRYCEKELEQRERKLGVFSQAVQNKKESWYDRIHVSVKTMDWVIGIVSGLLVIVIILIILEATGVFKL